MSASDDRPAEDLALRRRTTAAVLTKHIATAELEDGYRFVFPESEAWLARLRSFQAAWRSSCPHMAFEIMPAAGDGTRALEIRGPDGTKAWLENAQLMLRSSLNPAPSPRVQVRRAWRLLSSPLRVLPDFLIIGAKKCGTTSLYSYLIAHPEVDTAFRKEVHYFDGQERLGPLWYRSFFPTVLRRELGRLGTGRPRRTGEATPDYLYRADAPAGIRALVPRVRLIALLRNPVDRAYSFYNHNLRSGLEQLPFEEAIAREPERLAAELEAGTAFGFARNNFSYLERGRYRDQLVAWFEHFERDQLLLLSTEELDRDPAETLRRTLAFLDLPEAAPPTFRRMNAAPYPAMSPSTRAELLERMRPDNERLYELVGRGFGWEV